MRDEWMDLHCLDLCQLNITDDSIAVLAKGTEVVAVEVTSPTMLAWYVGDSPCAPEGGTMW